MSKKSVFIMACRMNGLQGDGEPDIDIYHADGKAEAKAFIKKWNESEVEMAGNVGGHPGYAFVVSKRKAESAGQWLKEYDELMEEVATD